MFPASLAELEGVSPAVDQGYLPPLISGHLTDYGYRAWGEPPYPVNDLGPAGKEEFVVLSPR